MAAFKLLSLRSIVAFFTLFTWAGALYLNTGRAAGAAVGLALVWGLVAMVLVSLLIRGMGRMTETGNLRLGSCVGGAGTVYLDIPAGGTGEVRVTCNGRIVHVKAQAAGGQGIKAGAGVRVSKLVGPDTLVVEENR
jgi:hypothetical protein